MKKAQYIPVPIAFLKSLFEDKVKAINDMGTVGIFKYAQSIDGFELKSVARQVIYDFYRGNLTYNVNKVLSEYSWDYIGQNEDYKGFNAEGKNFNPEEEVQELISQCKLDSVLMAHCTAHYQIHQAYQSLGTERTQSYELSLVRGKKLISSYPEYPFFYIKISTLLEIRNKDKSEKELMTFACYAAIRSIIGEKAFCKTNKNHILSRALGFTSFKEMTPEIKQSKIFLKYSKRYHMDQLISDLENYWSVKFYSYYMRGYYITTKKNISYEELIKTAEINKKKNKDEALKKKKRDTREEVLRSISEQ